jgi:hypothetical protein
MGSPRSNHLLPVTLYLDAKLQRLEQRGIQGQRNARGAPVCRASGTIEAGCPGNAVAKEIQASFINAARDPAGQDELGSHGALCSRADL